MRATRGLLLWSLALSALGIVLLLNNFLLLSGFNAGALWPLLLVIVGGVILLRGDIVPSDEARSFGITRGSVESAAVEISAAEIDVHVHALQREGRLIAGDYAANSRPSLVVNDNHANLKMERAATPWLSFADWSAALALDVPWSLFVTTYLGQVDLDLTGLVIQRAVIATGFGDVRLVCPEESFEPIYLRSALGNIHVIVPPGQHVRVRASGARVFRIHADTTRFEAQGDGVYLARDADGTRPLTEIDISGTFGDAYLA
ncbi:MAG: hypothetical protein ABI835_00990 [Chloroflexota bacterium]